VRERERAWIAMPSLPRALGMPCSECADLESAVQWCERWLRLRARALQGREAGGGSPSRLAAVFDIDATLVSDDARIEETCRLLSLCADLGIVHVLITARPEEGRSFTEDQLGRLGIRGHKRLYMHPSRVRCDSSGAGREKLSSRSRVAARGYDVVLNAGDALHDHFHPVPSEAKRYLSPHVPYVFLTDAGVAHLKL